MPSFRFFLIFCMVLTSLFGCDRERTNIKPTNIIIISIDTLRADHLGCYGYHKPTTPVLDHIASEGILFENISTPSPWTLPAHVSLVTGLYPSRHGVKSDYTKLPSDIPTLASVLSKHGFSTAAIVNSLYLDQRFGYAKGFDSYTRIPESTSPKGKAATINNLAIEQLKKRSNKPFFLFLHYYDVHSDYTPLPKYKNEFISSYKGIADGTTAQLLQFRMGRISLDKKDIQHFSNLYDGEIHQLDEELKRFFLFLQEEEMWGKTLLIVTSDHGEEFLEHGGVLHGMTQYQELIHVPLIIRGPGIPQLKRIKVNASLVDIMPTVLRIFGIEPPVSQDGIDLSPLWQKKNEPTADRNIYAEADHNNAKNDIKRAVIYGHYKLHYDLMSRELELFNLLKDPGEKNNLATKNTSMRNQLFRRLRQFMKTEKKGQPLGHFSPEQIKRLRSLGYLH